MSLAALTLKDFSPAAVIEGWNTQAQDWEVAHWAKVRECREAQKGEQLWSLNEKFDAKGSSRIRLRLPQTSAIPLQMIATMSRKHPQIRRFATSPSPKDQTISSNIETWSDSALRTDVGGRELLDWPALCGKLLFEGACAVIAAPSRASWERFPDFLDTVDKQKYKRLAANRKARYTDQGDGSYARVDSTGSVVPKKRYWRDKKGRTEDDEYYRDHPDETFVRDEVQTEQAYEKLLASVLAHRPPFNVRIISSTDAMPVYGPGGRLLAIRVRSRYTRDALIKWGYIWADEDDALVKTGKEDTYRTGDVTLHEYWGYDKGGVPIVAYAVEGISGNHCDTYFTDPDTGEERPAIINLTEEHGLTRLPATWIWGQNIETDDYPNKAVPFLWPTLSMLSVVEMFMSAKAAHALQHGFPSWIIDPNAEIIKLMPDIMLEGNKPRSWPVEPNTIYMGPGTPRPLVAPETAHDVNDTIHSALQMVGMVSADPIAAGGPGAQSGHDRSLARSYVDTAMGQVLTGALKAYEFVAECLLEIASAITDQFDVMVPIYSKAQVPQAMLLGRGTTPDRAPKVLELDPDWLNEIYDVEAFYPWDPFENIALINLYSQLYKDGLISWEEWRGILGDEHPEMSRILLWINQQLNTEDGKALVASMANDIMGGDLQAEIKRLVDQGLMTPDGEPVDSLVDQDEMRALEYFANRRKAHQLLGGAGPMGPGVTAIPGTAPAVVGGAIAPSGFGPQHPGMTPGPMPPGSNQYTPPGHVQAPPPQGAPGQQRNIGTGLPNLANSALGGEVAGASEIASIRRDELHH